jgi:hypothetical protein
VDVVVNGITDGRRVEKVGRMKKEIKRKENSVDETITKKAER